MTTHSTPPAVRSFTALALAVVPVAVTLVAGQFATFPNLPWYAGLAKPAFNPPSWLFGPVWGVLYALMAFAAWRVWRAPLGSPSRGAALIGFYVQLVLNAAWAWMFFAAHSPVLGLVDIGPQWLAVLGALVLFFRVDRLAGWCLVPLAVWVGFAGALNVAIWWLNG